MILHPFTRDLKLGPLPQGLLERALLQNSDTARR